MRSVELGRAGVKGAAEQSAAVLRAGGVIVAPTETVYGLLTLWENTEGRGRIFALKRRPRDKLLQMLAADLQMAEAAGYLADDGVRALAQACWPGPLTVVAPSRDGGTIGLRIPNHAFIQELLICLGRPVAATSANASGEPPGKNLQEAVTGLAGQPDLAVDGGPVTGGQASTVVSLVGGAAQILRAGPISGDRIRTVLGLNAE
jgi:L-threonylcarbamoyladenylate synthase